MLETEIALGLARVSLNLASFPTQAVVEVVPNSTDKVCKEDPSYSVVPVNPTSNLRTLGTFKTAIVIFLELSKSLEGVPEIVKPSQLKV